MAARHPLVDRVDPETAALVGLDPARPGEVEPLAMRAGGRPITPAEALAVLRRHTLTRRTSRPADGAISAMPALPTALPGPGQQREMVASRLPGDVLAFARARAEMEGVSLTAVIEAALTAYGHGEPGRPVGFMV